MLPTFSPVTSPAQLNIDVKSPSLGIVRVAAAGEIDLSSSEVLRGRLLNVLSALHPRRIEVDLAGVTFLDCRGLTVLVVAGQAAVLRRVGSVGHGGSVLRGRGGQFPVRRCVAISNNTPRGRMARASCRERPRLCAGIVTTLAEDHALSR